jgi:hypothetical protein
MSVAVLRYPTIYRVSDTPNSTYSIGSNGYGDALLSGGSGLVHGDVILIRESFTSYMGFFILTGYGPNAFRMENLSPSDYTSSNYVNYTQDHANVAVYKRSGSLKGWSCVHLPIVYGIVSTLFPVNSADTTRTVVGFANDNGFVRLTLSGAIVIEELDWLRIAGTSVEALDGPFQVITKYSNTQYTIAAPYSLAASAYTYASATAVRYYSNYGVSIRVYAGLSASHTWAALKPDELLATEVITPNNDNQVFFNVADIVKQKVEILKNRPNYDSMPYDLDRFTGFHVELAETYDSSDGSQVSTFVSSYVAADPGIELYAADAKLEFKNKYSGFLADYQYSDSSSLAKFLTLAARPVMWNGWYFELAFINSMAVAVLTMVHRQYNESGTLTGSSGTSIEQTTSQGIIRTQIPTSTGFYQTAMLGNANWLYYLAGWVNGTLTGAAGSFTSVTSSDASVIASTTNLLDSTADGIYVTYPIAAGQNISIDLTLVSSGPLNIVVQAVTAGLGTALVYSATGQTNLSVHIEYAALADFAHIEIYVSNISGVTVSSVLLTLTNLTYSETKRIDIGTECDGTGQYIYLTWRNALGGFDYWLFTANKDHNINILETQEKERNIYLEWDKSYGEGQDTIRQETSRRSRRELLVRSQDVERDQIDYISGIKTSSLVQIVTSKYNRRTVIVDRAGFTVRQDNDKQFNIEFSIIFTDEIPSQSL